MNTMIVLLTGILLVGTFAVITILKLNSTDDKKELSIDEVLKVSVDVPEITTNLKDHAYVKISFKAQTDGKKAKNEFKKRDFQIRNLLISELSEMKVADLEGKEGKRQLEESLKTKINELMKDGKVVKVYITSYIIS